MSFDLDRLVRRNIREMKPYSSARGEFSGEAEIFLDANENAFGSPIGDGLNRYPDPLQTELKNLIARQHGVSTSQIFIGNGSDEAVDLLIRIFCRPGTDEVITCPPTYGMYRVSAAVNDVRVREVPLSSGFELDADGILNAAGPNTKIVIICSPNNPTGNSVERDSIIELAERFDGIVVVDEAYIHFSSHCSSLELISDHPNLVVLQTFSKAWGMAGVRVGMAFADSEIIELFNRVKPPYNVSRPAQEAIIRAMSNESFLQTSIENTVEERNRLENELAKLPRVIEVFPSDANFLLVRFEEHTKVYKHLVSNGIIVRDRSSLPGCEQCLRITVGTPAENDRLLRALEQL